MAELICLHLGHAPYQPTLEFQLRLVERVRAAADEVYLLLVQHDPPVITLGRRGRDEDILAARATLHAAGVAIERTTRGGQVTFHGPGQLVGYPILHLRRHGLTLRGYVHKLEGVLLEVLGRLDVEGRRLDGSTGVWVGEKKTAAIGVAVARWVTYHGFALNVSVDLSRFDWIVACGDPEAGVTSVAEALGRELPVADVSAELTECFAQAFGLSPVRHLPTPREFPPAEPRGSASGA
jgi:lipoate-protein ligase B